jgi:hypothetical protein
MSPLYLTRNTPQQYLPVELISRVGEMAYYRALLAFSSPRTPFVASLPETQLFNHPVVTRNVVHSLGFSAEI